MPKTNVLSEQKYSKLLKDIRRLIDEGRQRASKAARHEMVRTYWEVGKRISEDGLTRNAGYGDAILEDLSEELAIDLTTLRRSVYFFQTYKGATSSTNLSWSHYKYLLPINDDQERQWYEQKAGQENWNVLRLSKAIKEKRYAQSQTRKGKIATTPGLKRPTEATYIYKAKVDRVVDGDTLLLQIDLGFQVLKEQRVRLAGIDAPSLDEPNGKEAAKFVRAKLAKVDFVMIKTSKIDLYGRYVGYVFYSFNELNKDKVFTKGTFLNQELVDEGLAEIL
jgi:endonuclease YncB( thermonuclease family)